MLVSIGVIIIIMLVIIMVSIIIPSKKNKLSNDISNKSLDDDNTFIDEEEDEEDFLKMLNYEHKNYEHKNYTLYGERNSGTNWIQQLMSKNFYVEPLFSYWKHGYPKKVDNTFYIIVIRNLESWLNSTYNRPYHMKKRSSFHDFVTKPVISKNPLEKGKNLFDIRYSKYLEYIEFLEQNGGVMVSLKFLQNNTEKCINIIAKQFSLKQKSFDKCPEHTKTGQKQKNSKYKRYKLKNLNKFINKDIETKIDNLTIKMYQSVETESQISI